MTSPGAFNILSAPFDKGGPLGGPQFAPNTLLQNGLLEVLKSVGYEAQVRQTTFEALIEKQNEEFNSLSRDDTDRKYELYHHTCQLIQKMVEECLQDGFRPFVLGGDHSVALGTVAGLAKYYFERERKIGLIWVDAHGDINTPSTSVTGNLHGMPVAHVINLGCPQLNDLAGFSPMVAPSNVVIIGARDLDRPEVEIIKKNDILCFSMADIRRIGMERVQELAIERATRGTCGFHLSWDFDWMDPNVMSAVNTPVKFGASIAEGIALLKGLFNHPLLLSSEFVEYNPTHDPTSDSLKMILSCFKEMKI